jgi:hypothetical protein
MKFIYFYSNLYLFYHEHIQENLKNYFELVPILIDDIKPIKGTHHFEGQTIKIELLIEQVYKNLTKTIIFSDATIFINSNNSHKLYDYIQNYKNYDMCFIKEGDNYNIGFIKINCNPYTLHFFKMALEILQENYFKWDQDAVNFLLKHELNFLKYTTYDDKIYCGSFNKDSKNDFLIYKSFIGNSGNKIKNYNSRIINFYNNELIDVEIFKKWIKK